MELRPPATCPKNFQLSNQSCIPGRAFFVNPKKPNPGFPQTGLRQNREAPRTKSSDCPGRKKTTTKNRTPAGAPTPRLPSFFFSLDLALPRLPPPPMFPGSFSPDQRTCITGCAWELRVLRQAPAVVSQIRTVVSWNRRAECAQIHGARHFGDGSKPPKAPVNTQKAFQKDNRGVVTIHKKAP